MIKSIILHVKPTQVLLLLRDNSKTQYISNLARQSGLTYVYTTKIITKFIQGGLVTVEEKGRIKIVRLTNNGMDLANSLDAAMKKMEQTDQAKSETKDSQQKQTEGR